MATPEQLQEFESARSARFDLIRLGVDLIEEQIADGGVPIEEHPVFIAAQRKRETLIRRDIPRQYSEEI